MFSEPYVEFTTEVPTKPSQIIARIAEQKEHSMRGMTIDEYRENQKLLAEARNLNNIIKFTPVTYYNVPCEWVEPIFLNDSKEMIIYFHGGSWMFGNLETARPITTILARQSSLPVLMVNYRLAPEHTYPAGFIDCYNIYQQVLHMGYNPKKIGIFGDSAGGNLALALLNRLKEENQPLPGCVALASPVTDMRETSAIVSSDDDLIYIRYQDTEQDIFSIYLGEKYGDKREDPTISPITGDLKALPPILMHSGELESITADNIAYAKKMYESGGDVKVKVWKDMFHDFSVVGLTLRESRLSIKEISEFFNLHLKKENSKD